MSVFDAARIIIYRCHEKGLEILLINNDMDTDPDVWNLPQLQFNAESSSSSIIELDDIEDHSGNPIKAIAVEGDWHDIPSIRGMIKHDVKRVKNKLKKTIPHLEHGTYFTVKEAFKKVLPHEYAALKELKEIVLDRNTALNI